MIEEEVIAIVVKHMKTQFPRDCVCCGQHYETLRDFCANTQPAGQPVVFDPYPESVMPKDPLGSTAFSNCACGTSMTLSSKGMPLLQYWALIRWGYNEMIRRRMTQDELLQYLREKCHEKVMAEPDTMSAGVR
jgi:hypothetical protein